MMKRAIVVAHSDDEVLWAGGLPLRYPGDWTIVCCSTPVKELDRPAQFLEACATLGAKAKLYPDEDVSGKIPLKSLDQVNLEDFDHIITHNKWGEYGHPHHKQVHHYVVSKYSHKCITTFGFRLRGFNFFGYRLRCKGTHRIDLTAVELETKMAALKKYSQIVNDDGKDIPLWQSLISLYCGKKGLNFSVETYDGSWEGF